MSRILKFIVNLFLIAAILVAVAILVPPLAGVTTTIVDTASMNTNLPLGSITYSTDIDIFDIVPGDEILKENDASTYAYVIREADPANGAFKAVSATDPDGAEEKIMLRNTVSKVAVVVPYIGYILIAMHSIEGIIIVVLVVVLMIILFILSELWKIRPEEEDEDEDGGESEKEEPRVTAKEETEIDTDVIRAAVEENHSAVISEDASRESAEADGAGADAEPDYSGMSWSERRAAKKARKQAEKAGRRMEDAADSGKEPLAADAAAAAAVGTVLKDAGSVIGSEAEEEALISEALASLSSGGQTETHEITEENRPSPHFAEAAEEIPEAPAMPEIPYGSEMTADLVQPETELPEEGGRTLAELAEEMEAKAKEAGTDGGYSPLHDQEDFIVASEADIAPAAFEIEETAEETAQNASSADRFAPTPRPTLDEILEETREAGHEPVVKKDDKSGISLVDVSNML